MSTNAVVYTFQLPGREPLFDRPESARHMLAALLDQSAEIKALLHYQDHRPVSGSAPERIAAMREKQFPSEEIQRQNDLDALPKVRWYSNDRYVEIVAIGDGAIASVDAQAMRLMAVLSQAIGKTPTLRRAEHEMSIRMTGRTSSHFIHGFVVRFKSKASEQAWHDSTMTQRVEKVRGRILRDLRLQAEWLDLDCTLTERDILVLPLPEHRGVGLGKRNAQGEMVTATTAIMYPRIEVHTSAEISGPWACGGLMARGYGRWRRMRNLAEIAKHHADTRQAMAEIRSTAS